MADEVVVPAAEAVVETTPVVETPAVATQAAETPAAPAAKTAEEVQAGALAALDTALDPEKSAAEVAARAEARAAKVAAKAARTAAAGEPPAGQVRGPDGKFVAAPVVPGAVVPPPGAKPAVVVAPAVDAAVEKEIIDLKLSGPASVRFRELNAQAKGFAPFKEGLEKAGVKDAQGLAHVMDRAQRAGEWEGFITQTRSTPEQVGIAFDVLGLINSGDPVKMGQGLDKMQAQLDSVARALGRSTGTYNPLNDHPDLAAAVEAEEITEKYALELAKQRGTARVATTTTKQTQDESANAENIERGKASLDVLGNQLAGSDPNYQAKLPYFLPMVKNIRATVHPSQWAQACLDAFRMIPEPPAPVVAAAAPARVPVGQVPMRPTGGLRNMQPQPKSALEALDMVFPT